LLDLSFHSGDPTFQLDDLGIGASIAAAAAIRGGSMPGLGSLTCALVEFQGGFESFDFCGITDRARAEEPAFPNLEELELELIQSHMTQKPMLRGEVAHHPSDRATEP